MQENANNNHHDDRNNQNEDHVVAAMMMTEAEHQTSLAVREQSDVILALTQNSNAMASTVLNNRISASSSRTTSIVLSDTGGEAEEEEGGLSLIDDDAEEDDIDEACLMEASEVAKQRAPMIRQQSNMILELTRTSDGAVNTASDMFTIANTDEDEIEYDDDDDDDDEELQVPTGTTSSVVQTSEEDAIKNLNRKEEKKKKKNRTKQLGDGSSSTPDTSGLGSSTSSTDEDNPPLPGACRVIRTNEGEGESSRVLSPSLSVQRLQPPPLSQHSQPNDDEEEDDHHSTSSSPSNQEERSVGHPHIHHEVEAQAVEDVTIVAQVITRDELMSEVRDQVLAEAGMMINNTDDEEQARQKKDMGQRKHRERKTLLTIILGGCLLIVVTVGLVFGLRGGDNNNNNNSDADNGSSSEQATLVAPTTAPSSMTETTDFTTTTPPQEDEDAANEEEEEGISPPVYAQPSEEDVAALRERIVPILARYGTPEKANNTNNKFDKANSLKFSLYHLANDPNWRTYSDGRLFRRFILGALFLGTNDTELNPNWINYFGWIDYNVHECLWYGVVVTATIEDNVNGILPDGGGCEALPDDSPISLHLSNNGMNGKVPMELSFLSDALVSIDFSNNNIEGFPPIPLFFELPNLKSLNLRGNLLGGRFRINDECEFVNDDNCKMYESSTLKELDLGNNAFFGELPILLSSLQQLEIFRVDGNIEMEGTIPGNYCDMQQLNELNVFHTSIVGEMPSCFCDRGGANNNNNNEVADVFFLAQADCRSGNFTCSCCEGYGCGL